MLPILAVILGIAQCAIAAPSVAVSAYPIDQYPVTDSGRFVNRFIIEGPTAYIDSASIPFYASMLIEPVADQLNSADVTAQAGAVVNAIALLGELVSGIPGDACESAALINAYAYAVSTGNNAGLKQAVSNYVGRLSTYIDLLVQLIVNPRSVKYTTGPTSSCLGGGRTYQFEEAWDGILNNANPYQITLLNEIYCLSRRMYNAFSVSNNNVAAAVTATSVPAVAQVGRLALNELVNFLRAVGNGGSKVNLSQAAATAKGALVKAVANVSI